MSRLNAPVSKPTAPANQDIFSAAKGGGIIFIGKIFTYVSRFIMVVLIARLLGAEQYGLYNLALTASAVAVGLAMLGLRDTTVRYVSLFAARKDEAGLWGTLQLNVGLTFVMSILLGAGLYIFANPIAQQIFEEPQLAPLLRISSLTIPFLALSNILAAATRGFKNMVYTTLAQHIIQPLLRLVLTLIVAFFGLTAAKVIGVYNFTLLVIFLLLIYFLNRQFSLKRPLRFARYETKELLKFSYPIYLSDLIRAFGGNIQIVLMGVFNTVTNVGILTVATRINSLGEMFHLAIVTTSMPIVSALYDQGDREGLRHFYQTMTKWTFTLNLPLFLIVLLFPEQILIIFGKSFVDGATALTILAWANLVNTGTGICGVLLDMSGNTKLKLVNSIVTVILNIGLNILFIPIWGLIGAAIAALVAAVTVNLLRLFEVFFVVRMHPYNISFLKPIFAAITAWAILLIFRSFAFDLNNPIFLALNILTLLGVYIAALLLLGLSQEDRAVLNRLYRRAVSMWPRQK